ncbi:MAG: Rid family hydrolase [Candidatus Eisenbacteria bacterium]
MFASLLVIASFVAARFGIGWADLAAATLIVGLNLRAGFEHVVRTRIYVTDITRWEEVGRAHGQVFGRIRPATTMVEVSRLIDPDMLVEIEADAIVTD